MPKLREISGKSAVKILCNKFGFQISGHSGSHVRLSKMTPEGKIGTVVPMHGELKIGTLRGILKLAKIDPDDFSKYL
ncbi:MAG: type II toxin-antitoxin system HicA family toxin [Candidatus Methanoperedens sp.]|nr:type II toxin-antitoxin system HicA family toxin [Candidatus Methanoperedens sp.]MCZ7405758.1 type II toxin-antitoxin system HicA family toxin [Candidatus Methanoperedens sp.]